jgi:hypothetical protein
MKQLWRISLLLMVLLAGVGAQAASRALLVGVSQLSQQSDALWLQAPRNDVLLMRETLRRQGLAPDDITVLADGVEGAALPDAAAIHAALGRLLERSRSGDFVLLYFSGHGTRVRDDTKRYQEPDGLAESFLARDARRTEIPGAQNVLTGTLRDVEVDGWIRAFLAKNVFVWAVFDTCSATSMTRSLPADDAVAAGPPGDVVRFRSIRVEQLARGKADDRASPAPPPETLAQPRARYVGFFASESHQVAPELKLPRNTPNAQPQGLLTWALAKTLARKPANFRELFNGVLTHYPPVVKELQARFPQRELPSPVAEGSLDAPLFANDPVLRSTLPQWEARREGARLVLPVGRLDGLDAGQPLRVTATLDDGTRREALTRLARAEIDSATLDLPAALAPLDSSTAWTVTPTTAPAALALRVDATQPLPPYLSLSWPASIVRVSAAAASDKARADVRWHGGTLELLAPELRALIPGGLPAADDHTLVRLAQLKWAAYLATLAQGGRIEGFDATLERWQGDRLVASQPLAQAALTPQAAPAPGERTALVVRNGSGQSLDLVILGIDAGGGLHALYPETISEANRFEHGTREAPALKRFDLTWLTPDARLLLLASPATPWSAPRLFGLAPPEASGLASLARVRGTPRARGHVGALVAWSDGTP